MSAWYEGSAATSQAVLGEVRTRSLDGSAVGRREDGTGADVGRGGGSVSRVARRGCCDVGVGVGVCHRGRWCPAVAAGGGESGWCCKLWRSFLSRLSEYVYEALSAVL